MNASLRGCTLPSLPALLLVFRGAGRVAEARKVHCFPPTVLLLCWRETLNVEHLNYTAAMAPPPWCACPQPTCSCSASAPASLRASCSRAWAAAAAATAAQMPHWERPPPPLLTAHGPGGPRGWSRTSCGRCATSRRRGPGGSAATPSSLPTAWWPPRHFLRESCRCCRACCSLRRRQLPHRHRRWPLHDGSGPPDREARSEVPAGAWGGCSETRFPAASPSCSQQTSRLELQLSDLRSLPVHSVTAPVHAERFHPARASCARSIYHVCGSHTHHFDESTQLYSYRVG